MANRRNTGKKSQDTYTFKVEKRNYTATARYPLEGSLNTLAKAGGFDFLEAIVDGIGNCNPLRRKPREYFLH